MLLVRKLFVFEWCGTQKFNDNKQSLDWAKLLKFYPICEASL